MFKRHDFWNSRDGITGKTFEIEVLGICKNVGEKVEYLPFHEAMKDAISNQPWDDPTDPEPRFPRDLHFLVCEEMNIDCCELRYYTAVGTAFDYYHGVDAFFTFRKGKKVYWVTLDLSLRKKTEYKADILVGLVDRIEDVKAYAKEIAQVFGRKTATI